MLQTNCLRMAVVKSFEEYHFLAEGACLKTIGNEILVGYFDLPIEKPKKVVTKTFPVTNFHPYSGAEKEWKESGNIILPIECKNVRITYEIEE